MGQFPPLLERLRPLLAHSQVYLVGGAVRDALLGRPIRDLDFALAGDAIRLARTVADHLGLSFYILDAERGIGRVVAGEEERMTLDFARFRGPDLAADLAGRDFTVNALALPATATDLSELIDPLGGRQDLERRLLRATSDTAFQDDPVRVIRAVRLALQLGFTIEPHTQALLRAAAGLVGQPAPERSRDELAHILAGPGVALALRQLDELGALAVLIPEIEALKGLAQPPPERQDVWGHTLVVLETLEAVLGALGLTDDGRRTTDNRRWAILHPLHAYRRYLAEHLAVRLSAERPRRALLFLAALLHDVGKPQTRRVDKVLSDDHAQVGAALAEVRLRALRFSSDEVDWVRCIIAGHTRPAELVGLLPLSRRDIYRYYRALGEAGVDVGLLALAQAVARWGAASQVERWQPYVQVVATLLEHYFRRYTQTIAPAPLLTGDDLIRELGLQPGPVIGQVLEAIREAQAAGEVRSRSVALALARRILNSS